MQVPSLEGHETRKITWDSTYANEIQSQLLVLLQQQTRARAQSSHPVQSEPLTSGVPKGCTTVREMISPVSLRCYQVDSNVVDNHVTAQIIAMKIDTTIAATGSMTNELDV